MSPPPFPNFLVIGAAKSGTTTLYHTLKQHPQIYMTPVKEPSFFSFEGCEPDYRGPGDDRSKRIAELREYLDLFRGVKDEIAIGEASTSYLLIPRASERISHYVPHARLIAVLRNPVERAYSNYLNLVQTHREPQEDFLKALEEEPRRIQEGWSHFWYYKANGFYYRLLKRYYDRFPREKIMVLLFDQDWEDRRLCTVQRVFGFLGVQSSFLPDLSRRHMRSGIARNKKLDHFLTHPHVLKNLVKPLIPSTMRDRLVDAILRKTRHRPPLPPEARRLLIDEFREDILQLQDLIGRDLSHWLEG